MMSGVNGKVKPSGITSSSERYVAGSAPAGGMGYGMRTTACASGVTWRSVHCRTFLAGGGMVRRSTYSTPPTACSALVQRWKNSSPVRCCTRIDTDASAICLGMSTT